jgi:predicted ATPase
MSKIEGFKVRNYRALQNVQMGKFWNENNRAALNPMTVVIGKNGVGKSSLFDAFGFLADCLKTGVEEACDSRGRGGFERIRSRGQIGPIEFEVYYRGDGDVRPITYELAIDLDSGGRPYVLRERLRQRRKGQSTGRPLSFLRLQDGKGIAWKGDNAIAAGKLDPDEALVDIEQLIEKSESAETEAVQLSSNTRASPPFDALSRVGILAISPRTPLAASHLPAHRNNSTSRATTSAMSSNTWSGITRNGFKKS